MNGERTGLSDQEIGRHLKDAVKASPLSQAEIARRVGVGTQAASEYVNAMGEELSDRFKPLAFLVETGRSSPEAFESLLPLFHQEPITEPTNPVLRKRVELIVEAHGHESPAVQSLVFALEMMLRELARTREDSA